ncbi:hypothetical protein AD998_17565 [bacterium 336/3]|nr:hypothetical protein AD998_17565 [bacterium 336/3]
MNNNRCFFIGIVLFFFVSCGKKECIHKFEILVEVESSHPCIPTGSATIISPIKPDFLYKIDDNDFQTSTYFTNLKTGKHKIYIKENDGCETIKEFNIDTLQMGIKFREVANILRIRCSSCHSGINPQAGLDFTNSCDILNNWNRIEARAIQGVPTSMPPSGLVSLEERMKLIEWIKSNHKYEE